MAGRGLASHSAAVPQACLFPASRRCATVQPRICHPQPVYSSETPTSTRVTHAVGNIAGLAAAVTIVAAAGAPASTAQPLQLNVFRPAEEQRYVTVERDVLERLLMEQMRGRLQSMSDEDLVALLQQLLQGGAPTLPAESPLPAAPQAAGPHAAARADGLTRKQDPAVAPQPLGQSSARAPQRADSDKGDGGVVGWGESRAGSRQQGGAAVLGGGDRSSGGGSAAPGPRGAAAAAAGDGQAEGGSAAPAPRGAAAVAAQEQQEDDSTAALLAAAGVAVPAEGGGVGGGAAQEQEAGAQAVRLTLLSRLLYELQRRLPANADLQNELQQLLSGLRDEASRQPLQQLLQSALLDGDSDVAETLPTGFRVAAIAAGGVGAASLAALLAAAVRRAPDVDGRLAAAARGAGEGAAAVPRAVASKQQFWTALYEMRDDAVVAGATTPQLQRLLLSLAAATPTGELDPQDGAASTAALLAAATAMQSPPLRGAALPPAEAAGPTNTPSAGRAAEEAAAGGGGGSTAQGFWKWVDALFAVADTVDDPAAGVPAATAPQSSVVPPGAATSTSAVSSDVAGAAPPAASSSRRWAGGGDPRAWNGEEAKPDPRTWNVEEPPPPAAGPEAPGGPPAARCGDEASWYSVPGGQLRNAGGARTPAGEVPPPARAQDAGAGNVLWIRRERGPGPIPPRAQRLEGPPRRQGLSGSSSGRGGSAGAAGPAAAREVLWVRRGDPEARGGGAAGSQSGGPKAGDPVAAAAQPLTAQQRWRRPSSGSGGGGVAVGVPHGGAGEQENGGVAVGADGRRAAGRDGDEREAQRRAAAALLRRQAAARDPWRAAE